MKDLFLIIYLASGTRLIEPVNTAECEAVIYAARAVDLAGGYVETDHAGGREQVTRLSCGDHEVVLAITASQAPCEWEGA